MKQRNLASLLAVTISLEMMIAPVAFGQQPQGGGSTAPAQSQRNEGILNADNINTGIRTLGNVWNTYQQSRNQNQRQSPQMAGDMAHFQRQMTPMPDKYFSAQKLSQIPGLGQYLALNNINPNQLNCATLPTTLHEARPEVCRIGVMNDKGIPPQAQLNEAFTYYNQYLQIGKLYKNYSVDSNKEGQGFGIGCMNNAMNILNGFFKYRLDELDKLTTNLEALNNQFREASRSDLDAIEEAVAVLDGNSDMADKVKSKKPDLFDFGKRFNNPACNSMFSGDKLNQSGREGGLNKISADLKASLTTKSGKHSGESYAKSHADVVSDLESIADKVSKQLELNFSVLSKDPSSYGKFLTELPDLVSSPNNANRALTPDLFSDVQSKFNENFMKLNEQKSVILSELRSGGVPADAATNLLGSANASNFESEVGTIENKLKNNCLQTSLTSFNRERLMDKIYDPSASKHANKHASNFLKDKINQILDNQNSSLEKKLADLKALENQTGSRYYMKMENSYEVQDVDANGNVSTQVVGASTIRTPSVFFSDVIRNCNAQFKANKLDNKMSGASAIQKLRQLNREYKNLAQSQAADMRKEVRKKLIECSSSEDANNTVPGSCTPERFNTSAPGFCANAAFSCSKNMQACTQQAEKYVKEIKDQKTARVNNYKALVQKNKHDIVKIFDSALARYMKEGEMMRGLFGAGFSSPAGIQREVMPESARYLTEFQDATSQSPDGRLLLEDPDKYVEMFKQNIAVLKKSVEDQQNQILGGNQVGKGKNSGLFAEHIRQTEKNYQSVISQASTFEKECQQKHDNAVAEAERARQKQNEDMMKQQQELGEHQRQFCQRFNQALNGHPGPACEGNLADLSRTLGSTADDFVGYCDETQNDSSSTGEEKAYEQCLGVPSQLQVVVQRSDAEISRAVRTEQRAFEEAERQYNEANGRLTAKKNAHSSATDAAEKTRLAGEVTALEAEVATKRTAMTSAKDALDDKKDELARTTRPADNQGTASDASPELIAACDAFRECSEPATYEGTGEDRIEREACRPAKLNSTIKNVLRLTDAEPTLTAESAPAFCNAGDNSGRHNFKSNMDTFSEELARAMGQSRQ